MTGVDVNANTMTATRAQRHRHVSRPARAPPPSGCRRSAVRGGVATRRDPARFTVTARRSTGSATAHRWHCRTDQLSVTNLTEDRCRCHSPEPTQPPAGHPDAYGRFWPRCWRCSPCRPACPRRGRRRPRPPSTTPTRWCQRADPHIFKHTDGYYYFTATVPQYDRIVLRRATTLQGWRRAAETVIWRRHTSGEMGAHIWAPEIHFINGRWYIYFAAGRDRRHLARSGCTCWRTPAPTR